MMRALMLLCLLPSAAMAHRLDPALLQIEPEGESYRVLWTLPVELAQAVDGGIPGFPSHCKTAEQRRCDGGRGRTCVRLQLQCEHALAGHELSFPGLEVHANSVLVEWLGEPRWTAMATGAPPKVTLPGDKARAWSEVLKTYLLLGVEHILIGLDHLLFVLGLLLLVTGVGRLIATITAFTVGHSITLAAAILGWVSIPSGAVEAIIALSVLLLAVELTHGKMTLTKRYPWAVAGGFGLLHGFGFAGVLTDLGLTSDHVPLALAGFNIGVELGQILFVLGVLALMRIPSFDLRKEPLFASYVIGVPAAAWTIERLMALAGGA